MIDLNTIVLVITLNISVLNVQVKIQRLVDWILKFHLIAYEFIRHIPKI